MDEQQRKAEFVKIESLMKSGHFSYSIAKVLNNAYLEKMGLPKSEFLFDKGEEDTAQKDKLEEAIATNIAGFYALECGLDYLSHIKNELPSSILRSIVENTIDTPSLNMLARFANATWKAGQPFRGLERINRETFTPFYFLTEKAIEKDIVQIKAAANFLLSMF